MRAGEPLASGYAACLWSIIGDLDYFFSILKLPNFNSARPCPLCRCSLTGTNSWSNFSPEAPWRSHCWSLESWKKWPQRSPCPLFQAPFLSALTVHLDYLHSKYLGVDQYCYGSVLALLTCRIMSKMPQENIEECWKHIRSYYSTHRTSVRFKNLGKLTMYLRRSGTPKLRGKAGEIRHLAGAMLSLWNAYMHEELEIHRVIRMTLKSSLRMEELIFDHRQSLAFPREAAEEFNKCCENYLSLNAFLSNHFAEEETSLFLLTSKTHMLQHISLLSHCLSPRLALRPTFQDVFLFFLSHFQDCLFLSFRGFFHPNFF